MRRSACPEDLLVRERRQALSEDERRSLGAHLRTCALCRMARTVGSAIDRLEPVEADTALAARLVAATLASRSLSPPIADVSTRVTATFDRRRLRAHGWRRFAVAAGVLLVAGSALAGWRTFVAPRLRARGADVSGSAAATAHKPKGALRHDRLIEKTPIETPPANEPPSVLVDPTAVKSSSTDSVRPAPLPVPPSPAQSAPPTTTVRASRSLALVSNPGPRALPANPHRERARSAAELFAAANAARGLRQLSEAAGFYRSLQASFPDSAEAKVSYVSLGELCFSRGAFREALGQFEAYLASDDATLAEEALVGRARALAALGRTEDERATWRTLLSRFPQSDYRWRAQQRLGSSGAAVP